MIFPYLYEFIEILVQKGISHVVISPGSRSAPLTIALARHPKIKKYVVVDERSAGFIALGMALATQKPVALVCTSGSAVLNYFPAVSEAFFQEIPVLLLTADRPNEWLNQKDGQTIFQKDVFQKHVKAFFELPTDHQHLDTQWYSNRIANEATNLLLTAPFQPIHINIPLREPLYPTHNEEVIFPKMPRLVEEVPATYDIPAQKWKELGEIWQSTTKKMLVVGQMPFDKDLNEKISVFKQTNSLVVVADTISNISKSENDTTTIAHHDLILTNPNDQKIKMLRPELLITFGKSLISKGLKNFIRTYPPKYHWHIQPAGEVADTFQCLTHILRTLPSLFLEKINQANNPNAIFNANNQNIDYQTLWQNQENKAIKFLDLKIKALKNQKTSDFSELEATATVLESLPESSKLHLANSMPVRYVNFFGNSPNTQKHIKKHIEILANRGTSGIDGSTSTALGYATQTSTTVTLLTGDMAFFYDRNAFWNNFIPKNLRIILMNNHAGNIFRLIDAKDSPELETYFETSNPLTATHLAKETGLHYAFADDREGLDNQLKTFFESSETAKILEIQTDKYKNAEIWQSFKNEWLNFEKD